MGTSSKVRVNIMVKPKSPYSYANQISMSRQLYKDTYVIVEGDSDAKLFNKFIDKNRCRVKDIPGKVLAIQALNILEKRKEKGILLVVDADFDHLENIKPISKNMFYTDTHDIETMIISTEAFENFLSEFTDKRKLEKFEKNKSKSLREILIEVCIALGYVRWSSLRNNWKLKFKDLDYTLFIDINSIFLRYNNFILELMKNSPRNPIPPSKIINEAKILKSHSNDPWMICCGHDLTETLKLALKNIFGYNIAKLTRKKLEAMLRLSYEFRFFQKTKLYQDLNKWVQNNTPFIIFS